MPLVGSAPWDTAERRAGGHVMERQEPEGECKSVILTSMIVSAVEDGTEHHSSPCGNETCSKRALSKYRLDL